MVQRKQTKIEGWSTNWKKSPNLYLSPPSIVLNNGCQGKF